MGEPDDLLRTRDSRANPGTDPDAPTIDSGPRAVLPSLPELRRGEQIGPYRLVDKIGEGGFGEVWQAERLEPIHQIVALKVIKAGMDTRSVLARFEQERQALAVMDHPNVAKVLDAGATVLGKPYFVMEYVRGRSITSYCDERKLTIRQRLELFLQVCDAVQHAHNKAIIHRDLKPSNILVSDSEGGPLVKVIDFGVAKATGKTLTDKTIFTEMGMMVGTPEYMSPEQAEAGRLDVDTRTDVYSLGVVLYELLTGVLPFDPRELRSKAYAEIQRIIKEVDPPTPSTRLTKIEAATAGRIAAARGARLDELERELRRELEWVPLKAMRKERDRRYRTPTDLADDIRNYLQARPLSAGPEAATYQLRKFVTRNRGGVAAAAAIAATLVGATLVSVRFGIKEAAARHEAEVQRQVAQRTTDFLSVDLLQAADPELGGVDTKVIEVLDKARAALGQRFAGDPAVAGRIARSLGEAYLALGEGEPAKALLEQAIASLGPGISEAERLEIGNRLAEARYRVLEGDKAIAELRPLVDESTRKLGGEDRRTLNLRNQLAGALRHAGQLDEAEDIYRDVLAIRTRVLGPGDVDTLIVRHNLGIIELIRARRLRSAGDEAGATRALSAALAERERLTRDTQQSLGPQHPQTLASRAELAGLLAESGRTDDALAMYPGLLEQVRRVLGMSHWRALETQARYGRALARAGRASDAADELAAALEGYRLTRGVAHPQSLIVATLAAESLAAAGRGPRARAILERAITDAGLTLGDTPEARDAAVRALYEKAGRSGTPPTWRSLTEPPG